MENVKTIYTELNRIQKELKAPKNQKNNFGGFNYRSAEDILLGYKQIACETTLVLNDEMVQIGDRYYIKATATLEYKGDTKYATAFAREPLSKKGMDESQVTGATSSYARKYALNGLLAIDDSKDTDFTDGEKKEIEVMEGHESAIEMIDSHEDLKSYWNEHKGLGKEFGALVTKRKYKLQQNENA